MKAEKPSFFDKVKGIEGDCSLQGLGLSNSDRNLLIRDVSAGQAQKEVDIIPDPYL